MKSILPYTDEHKMFRAGFARFVENEIAPYYDQWEKDKIIPRQLYEKMANYGYYNPDGDPEYDGDGGDFLYWQIILEELGRKGFLSVHNIVTAAIMIPYFDAFATKEQKTAGSGI
ncbi:MAG TPA: acyl-CoA dehydrogenase family protein [Tepidanaerobacteraceae bacterium]|nr:acyl-CoA dehydrogenase family protein [Tepidanaerobacteraceae bacterium]